VTFCILQNIPPDYVLSHDIKSLGALIESVHRVQAVQKYEQAYTMMHAAQADQKSMEKWLKPWKKLFDPAAKGGDEKAFLSKFGKGI
jgi:hypothetical protein